MGITNKSGKINAPHSAGQIYQFTVFLSFRFIGRANSAIHKLRSKEAWPSAEIDVKGVVATFTERLAIENM